MIKPTTSLQRAGPQIGLPEPVSPQMRVRSQHAAGFSLVELMVGIVVGLVVIAGTIAVFMTVLAGSNHTIRETRLNQELRVAMNFMVDDLRRAGFWRDAGNMDFGAGGMPAHPNPFADRVGWNGRPVRDIFINGDRNCILFSYDATFDENITPQEVFGFRLVAGAIDMLTANATAVPATVLTVCTASGVWTTLTDNTINVTTLGFDTIGSTCFNGSDDTTWDVTLDNTLPACDPANSDPTPPSSGDVLIDSRVINIELEAQHSQNPSTALTLRETVKVRNNRVHRAP